MGHVVSGLYEQWAKDLPLGHNGPINQALWGALAKVVGDNSLADAQSMVFESLPGYASAGANGLTANDRGLEKGPAESDDDFAARLLVAADQWALAGTPVGLLMQLWWSGFEEAVLVQQNGIAHTLTGAPVLEELSAFVAALRAQAPIAFPSWYVVEDLPNANPELPASADGKPAVAALTIPWWSFDGGMDAEGNQYCGRFALVFPSSAPEPGLGTAATLARLRRIVEKWRPTSRKCMGFYVQASGAAWNDLGLEWGGFNYGGSSTLYSAS